MDSNWTKKLDEIYELLERCATHEARIAELSDIKNHSDGLNFEGMCALAAQQSQTIRSLCDELARVKAESLRVVELPLDYELPPDWYMTPSGLGWDGSDCHGSSCVETPDGYHDFADCKPVRLERWPTLLD